MKVGLIFPSKDPVGVHEWSGTPHGLWTGLRSIGAEVVPIGHFFPPVIRQIESALARVDGARGAVADRASTRVRARRWSFQRQIDRAGELDVIIAMVPEAYPLQELRAGCPIVTYGDSTLLQMYCHSDSDIANSGFPEAAIERWIANERTSISSADVACTATNWSARSLVDDYEIPSRRVAVVGMGHRPRVSATTRDKRSAPSYLFVGVDWRRKNGQRVLEAFRRVRKQHPAATLHLVGKHQDVHEPGVVDHGHLAKNNGYHQRQLDKLYEECTVFVLPSLFEPYGIAYYEAASSGMAVIATDQGGGAELLGDGAFVVDPHDEDAIFDAMCYLSDGEMAYHRGELAKAAALHYRWEDVVGSILRAAGVW